ncbi:capsule biosynthesis protein, partial [Bacteroides fragilis]
MGKKVLVFLLLLSFIGWTKAQQEELQNGTEQSKQLQVFGRNIFASWNLSFEPNLNIPTPENYRLGPGDEVIIDVWGTSENTVRETISPEGSIMVENIGPIYLSGMNMEEA